jgi:lipoprotein-anchoring transpeptidase ErfK/SrfK
VRYRAFLNVSVGLTVVLALAVPAWGDDGVVHVVERGENLYRIALRYGTTYQEVAAANGIANPHRIYVGQRLVIHGVQPESGEEPAASNQVHIVQRGENLYRIALRYGTNYHSLAAANGIRNPALIFVGQAVVIAGAGDGAAVPAVPSTQAPDATPTPSVAPGERWIDVDLSDQTLAAYEGETVVRTTAVSTGIARYPTPTGSFVIRVKYLFDDMRGPGYFLPDVPFSMYFHRAFAIHGTYWHSNFGTPMSHGCINLPTPEAEWLFYWASVGTPVVVHN